MSDDSPTTACPDAATLRALLDGTLPVDQQVATQVHVDRCLSCEAALRQMTAGGESWIGMAEKLKGGSEDDPNLAAALERLKADDGSGGEPSEPADPQRTLDFLQPADDPKLLGKLGQHEICEVVGWGGMGVVLKAYDPSLHRVVAVKVLASHLAHHAVARRRFIREAQAAAAVCHDNVVTIHAIDESGPQPKIIMQFVAGGSLQERIDQDGPLELKEILRIAMQTAAGLAAAHAQGVVHRDVKPSNILLENGVERVKLTDFGLARVMDDASLTLSGVIAGTPQYMAPEQAWDRDVDARADLFNLGAVMYAMCSGHSPFRARTTMAVLKRVCEDPPRPLRAINPDVPEWLVAIIEKLLAKNPDERFQSATEVSELLGRWLAHVQQPTVVSPPVGQAFQPDRNAPQNAVRPSTDSSKTRLARPSGQPRKADLPSLVTLARVWIPLLVFSALAALVVVEQLRVAIIHGDRLGTSRWPYVEPIAIALAHILAAGCCYEVFYVGWNTTGGRQRLATCILLAAVIWSSIGAIENLRQPYTFYFWPQAILCGGYLLAIVIRHVSQHGQEMLLLPGVRQAFQPDPNVSNSVNRASSQPGKADVPLSAKVALLPMLGIGTTVAIMLLLIVAAGETNNLPWFLGFAAWNLLVAFAVCSVIRTAWNTSSWLIWIGAVLLLPVVGQGFVMASSYQPNPAAPQLIYAVQALTAFALLFGLLFVRPFFVRGSERWMRERLTGWQRLFAIACFTIIGTPLTLAVMYWLPGTGFQVRPKSTLQDYQFLYDSRRPMTSEAAPQEPLGSQAFPKPRLLSESKKVLLDVDDIEEPQPIRKSPGAIADSLKPLQVRWVVVSSEGAALGSAALISGSGDSPFGPAVPGAPGGGSLMSAGAGMGGFGMMSSMGANVAVPSLQWIEFAAEQVVVFDGRHAKLFAEFSEDGEPRQLSLRHYSEQLPAAVTVWRNGIYRLDRDRLILCWTNRDRPVPTEFAGDVQQGTQLLVLRREWNPPTDFNPSETPPPRAVIPFTADEAKRFQDAWASLANVPVETTNSLGMKLRVLPPGSFDPLGTARLASNPLKTVGFFTTIPMWPTGASFTQPVYMANQEVTVAQFRKFVEATGYETTAERLPPESGTERRTWHHPGIAQDSDQHPVVHVSWHDAQALCRWLSDTEQQ